MSKNMKARIIAIASYLPERVLTNADLEKMVETTDEWIVSRTGMKERRLAAKDEFASDMGAKAALKALKIAQVEASDIDMIIAATMTPDYLCPATAALIQPMIGAVNAAAVDIQAACTGFLYALAQAKAFIESGMYKNVLVIATEKMSAFVDYKDRNTCILFGDGAAAALVTGRGAGFAVDTISLGADGQQAELFLTPAGGARIEASHETVDQNLHKIKMSGREIFKHAVRRMEFSAKESLAKMGLSSDEIAWLIPHQANVRIIDATAKACGFPLEKVYKTIHKWGNTSASSIAIALDELLQKEKLSENSHLLLVAFGAGLTWGSAVLTKIE